MAGDQSGTTFVQLIVIASPGNTINEEGVWRESTVILHLYFFLIIARVTYLVPREAGQVSLFFIVRKLYRKRCTKIRTVVICTRKKSNFEIKVEYQSAVFDMWACSGCENKLEKRIEPACVALFGNCTEKG